MQKRHLLLALKRALKADSRFGARKALVLGVGSDMRSDDAAGLRVAAAISASSRQGVHALEAGPAPENCTSEIRRLHPSDLIIVDSAQMGGKPGTLGVFKPSEIAGVSFGTHGLPLSVLADYLRIEVGCAVALIGIQPSNMEFGEALSPEVARAVAEVIDLLRDFFDSLFGDSRA
jgi:hydrogenase 3 maturation protease